MKLICKRIFKSALFIVIFCLIYAATDLCVRPLGAEAISRATWHDFYQQEENIDVVFLGGSAMSMAVDPYYFDEELKMNCFDLTTLGQNMMSSYYVLQEAINNYKISTVVINASYYTLFPVVEDWAQGYRYLVSDYMRVSMNKIRYLGDAYDKTTIADALLVPYRYNDYSQPKEVLSLLKTKIDMDYIVDYNSVASIPYPYVGKGHYYQDIFLNPEDIGNWGHANYDSSNFDTLWIDRIIDLCNENKIDFVAVQTPLPLGSILDIKDYAMMDYQINKYFSSKSVDYYNFSLAKPTFLQRNDDRSFLDMRHINYSYLPTFDRALLRVLQERQNHTMTPDDLFYSSYEDMYVEIKGIISVWLEIEDMEQNNYKVCAYSYQGLDTEIEYQFCYVTDDGDDDGENDNWKVIQEYSNSPLVYIEDETGTTFKIKVTARSKSDDSDKKEYILRVIPNG